MMNPQGKEIISLQPQRIAPDGSSRIQGMFERCLTHLAATVSLLLLLSIISVYRSISISQIWQCDQEAGLILVSQLSKKHKTQAHYFLIVSGQPLAHVIFISMCLVKTSYYHQIPFFTFPPKYKPKFQLGRMKTTISTHVALDVAMRLRDGPSDAAGSCMCNFEDTSLEEESFYKFIQPTTSQNAMESTNYRGPCYSQK